MSNENGITESRPVLQQSIEPFRQNDHCTALINGPNRNHERIRVTARFDHFCERIDRCIVDNRTVEEASTRDFRWIRTDNSTPRQDPSSLPSCSPASRAAASPKPISDEPNSNL